MNTTTLNMTTLDGGRIIKKGGGGTPTPPSGGEDLDSLIYCKVPEEGYTSFMQLFCVELVRIEKYGIKVITDVANILLVGDFMPKDIKYVAANLKSVVRASIPDFGGLEKDINSVEDYINFLKASDPEYAEELEANAFAWKNWEQITKEQFYSLD